MAHKLHHMEIHPAKNGGHTVEHYFESKPSKSGAFREMPPPEKHVFGADESGKMMAHVSKHLGISNADHEREQDAAVKEEEGGEYE